MLGAAVSTSTGLYTILLLVLLYSRAEKSEFLDRVVACFQELGSLY